MAVSSYGSATRSSGVVRIIKDLDLDLTDRHVLIVEDIVDSGLTLGYLRRNLAAREPGVARGLRAAGEGGPAEVRTSTSSTSASRSRPTSSSGYGLDVAERYRNLARHRRVRRARASPAAVRRASRRCRRIAEPPASDRRARDEVDVAASCIGASALAVVALVVVTRLVDRGDAAARRRPRRLPSSSLADGTVASVTLLDRDHVLAGRRSTDGTEFRVRFPEQYTDEITRQITRADVDRSRSTASSENPLDRRCCSSLLPFVFILGARRSVLSQAQGGGGACIELRQVAGEAGRQGPARR